MAFKHYKCNTVLPLVFDDSLSYYEYLCKIQNAVNSLYDVIDGDISETISNYINEHLNDLLLQASYSANTNSIILQNNTGSSTPVEDGNVTNFIIVDKKYLCKDEWLHKNTQHVFNIAENGGVGDGTADNSDAFINAIKYCSENNVPLYIPAGKYYVSRTLAVESNATIEIFGVGKDSIIQTSATTGLFFKHHSVINAHDFSIEGKATNDVCIESYARNSLFDHLFINCQNIGIRFCNHNNTISNCIIEQKSDTNQKEKAAIVADVLDGDDGVNWSVNNKIIGNSVTSNINCFAVVKSRNGHTQEGIICSDNSFLSTGVVACYLSSLFVGLFTNNVFDLATKYAVMLDGNAASYITIENCYLKGNMYGLYSFNAPEITIKNCTIFNSAGGLYFGGSESKNIIIAGNQISVSDVCVWMDKICNVSLTENMCMTTGATYLYFDDNNGAAGIVTGHNFKTATSGKLGHFTESTITVTETDMK